MAPREQADVAALPTAGAKDARRILGAEAGRKPSRLPHLHFPLVVILSLGWTAVGYSTVAQWTSDDPGAFAKLASRKETAILLIWRVTEIALGWFGNYDSYDLAALSLLAYGPTLLLFSAFYRIRPLTAAASLAVDVLSSVVPFALLRPLSAAHTAPPAVPNRELLVDGPIKAYTTLLASAVYTVTLALSYSAWLRKSLLLNFEGIPSIQPVISVTDAFLAVTLSILFGMAARTFIFAPAAATRPAPEYAASERFDPVRATLRDKLLHRARGVSAQTKTAIHRTIVMALASGVRTFIQCAFTIKGVELHGAVAYSGAWVAASLAAGAALGLVVE